MSEIKVLDKQVVQKIAAGEVVEKPASIVKELVENSLDANARNITIEIQNGGKSLIRVTDDGDGINEEEVELAFKRHSTSKLSQVNDLYNILTLGFRGEALASIASISKVELLTKTVDANAGVHAHLEEGQIQSIEKVGSAKGTTMIIRDIFYNLPVRKKFLKSDAAEGNSISDIVSRIALGNHNTSFKLIKDNKIVFSTNHSGNIKDNIYSILGKDMIKGLIPIKSKDDDYIKINGFISNNNLYRSNRNHQYLYLNGRYITNYSLANAVERNYTSNIPSNRHPVFLISLEINPNKVDVNIHPTKQEVKFENINMIYDQVYQMVNRTLYESLSTHKILPKNNRSKDKELTQVFDLDEHYVDEELVIKDLTNTKETSQEDPDYNFIDMEVRETTDTLVDFNSKIDIKNSTRLSLLDEVRNSRYIGAFFSTYLILENKNHTNIYIIDQHAAHERIMYERLRDQYESEEVHVQRLLAPEIFELTDKEFNLVYENMDLFEKLGFEISEFGHNTIQIRGVPLVFGKPNTRNLFLEILDNIDKDIKSNYQMKLDKIMKLSCTNAVKSGDLLANIEIDKLIKDLIICENPFNCPHGRPTIIEVSKDEVEKQFLRI